ncbi:translation initiation factor eIF-2B subunit alpha [Tieghemiomyces parasiticus]|uniref:Translation initiation factor eIF2B subunit alpha n=1 Tax=Tieghemiomyces parasiticus TaxID=78921 RepID=A0A9W8DVP4_9FUNG|nr:translation initiation factor eIF-2B subunit alpha [Tieghemiomyces parasiticus]
MPETAPIITSYRQFLAEDPDLPMPVAAVKALVEFIKDHQASTMSEFVEMVRDAAQVLKASSRNSISLAAGCDLFMQTVTRMSNADLDECRANLINRGTKFVEKAGACRESIAELGGPFIRDGSTILVHSYSRVIMALLLRAAANNQRFRVYVTESRPTNSGYRTAARLREAGVPCTVVLDGAVAYLMEKVDFVLVGAEGVVENGGLINHIGTYQLSIVAHAARKPFYAVAESYKFVRLFPLNQFDLPSHTPEVLAFDSPDDEGGQTCAGGEGMVEDREPEETASPQSEQALIAKRNPKVDYTPPSFITLLFTDLGVLTPSGVSDELIKLYY